MLLTFTQLEERYANIDAFESKAGLEELQLLAHIFFASKMLSTTDAKTLDEIFSRLANKIGKRGNEFIQEHKDKMRANYEFDRCLTVAARNQQNAQ